MEENVAVQKTAVEIKQKKILQNLAEMHNFCNDKWCNSFFHNSTGGRTKELSTSRKTSLRYAHLGFTNTSSSRFLQGGAHYHCADRSNIWTPSSWLSWAESLNTFHWCLENSPYMPAYVYALHHTVWIGRYTENWNQTCFCRWFNLYIYLYPLTC